MTGGIGSGSKEGAVGETMDTRDSSPVPPDPRPASPGTGVEPNNNDSEDEGRKCLDCPPRGGEKGNTPDSAEVNPFTLERLQTSTVLVQALNFHRLNEESLECTGLLLSEIAQYPVPPTIARRILDLADGMETQPAQETFIAFQLSMAIMDSAETLPPRSTLNP